MKDYLWGKETNEPQGQREPSFIEVIDNKVYFYSEITRDNVLQLVKTIRKLNKPSNQNFSDIELYISSYGGSIFAGLSIVDEIINSKIPVVTIVDGCAASAATLFSVVGKKRLIKAHSYMLIHQLSSMFFGKYQEFEDEMSNLKKLMVQINGIYKKYTKIPENELGEILKHDLYFDAKQCIKYGLVDEIIQG
jgi:ATP-dependent Clp endopeptidase proteolytic subunit ClpP